MKSLKSRGILIAGLMLWAIYLLVPTWIYFQQSADVRNDADALRKVIPKFFPTTHINLGLDLQGGVQLVLGVNTDEAIENKLSRYATQAQRFSEDKQLGVVNSYLVKGQKKFRVEFAEGTDVEKFKTDFKKEINGLVASNRDAKTIEYNFDEEQISSIKQSALEQAERVIRNRIDKWGVAEPIINRRADGSVLVQLPGFKDPERAKEFIGKTAQLRFHIVDDEFNGFDLLTSTDKVKVEKEGGSTVLVSEDLDALKALGSPKVPEDRLLLVSRQAIAGGNKYRFTSYVVKASAELSGDDIIDAAVARNTESLDQSFVVTMQFTPVGTKRFADVTAANVKKRLAIILDDVVEQAPVINEPIPGGRAEIKMGGTNAKDRYEEAKQLALVLKSGALPATVKVLEERQVGASLGPELASQGIKSTIVGLLVVFVFMVLWYRRPGAIACVALLLNALFLFALMGLFSFSLSLPGIAGFILTLGMAVDSNVLINERIRQELSEGKNAKAGVEYSFKRVFWTILDANITTLIAAFVLLQTNSSGPVAGFAITLILGLVVSLFTALFCTRFLFEWVISKCKTDKEIRFWLGADKDEKKVTIPKIDFFKWVPTASAISLICFVAVLGMSFSRGLNWAVDFAGGTEVLLSFNQSVDGGKLEQDVKSAGVKNLIVQSAGTEKKQYILRFEKDDSTENTDAVDAAAGGAASSKLFQNIKGIIEKNYAEQSPQFLRVDFVGPQIGRELRNQGIQSLLWAILGILAYVWWRFDMRFSPGAVLKMFQDVFMALAFYAFFWRSFDLTSIAALLTVIGYSVNDVVVIYDRVRENLAEHPRKNLKELVNLSLNETLSRSIITSVTTLISLTGILLFGTDEIWNFAAAVAVGVVAATFSSTFIASAAIVWTDTFRKNWEQKKVASQKVATAKK